MHQIPSFVCWRTDHQSLEPHIIPVVCHEFLSKGQAEQIVKAVRGEISRKSDCRFGLEA
jgi:hypothetical protein